MNRVSNTPQPLTEAKSTAFGEINARLALINVRLEEVSVKQSSFHDRLTGPQVTEDTKASVNSAPSAIGWQVNDNLHQIETLISNIEYHTNRLADIA